MAEQEQVPPPGSTSIRLGPAYLRPARERDHYELVRPIFTLSNEGDRLVKTEHPEPVGPIAVYRTKRRGDKVDMTKVSIVGAPPEMKTSDPHTNRPIELILVWWAGMDGEGT